MQLQNIEFLKQFRKEEISLPGEDRQSSNMQFRHFRGSRKGRHLLEGYLENQLSHSELVDGLIRKIEAEDEGISRRLTRFMRKTLKTFAAYGRRGSHHYEYLRRVSAEIGEDVCGIGAFARGRCLIQADDACQERDLRNRIHLQTSG